MEDFCLDFICPWMTAAIRIPFRSHIPTKQKHRIVRISLGQFPIRQLGTVEDKIRVYPTLKGIDRLTSHLKPTVSLTGKEKSILVRINYISDPDIPRYSADAKRLHCWGGLSWENNRIQYTNINNQIIQKVW